MVFANSMGMYMCVDDNTLAGNILDIARVLVRVPCGFNLKDNISVLIDDIPFELQLREDTFGPVRISYTKVQKDHASSSSSSEDSWSIPDNSSCGSMGRCRCQCRCR